MCILDINDEHNEIDVYIKIISCTMDKINQLSLKVSEQGQHVKSDCLDDVNLYLNIAIEQLEVTKEILN